MSAPKVSKGLVGVLADVTRISTVGKQVRSRLAL
jgi:hypothetical protein